MPSLSIVTCTFNAAENLPRTLESVSAQDCRDIEHIIIDGKSSDSTPEIIEEYKRSAARGGGRKITVVSEKDDGLYDAMNKGLSLAAGDYVVFVNAGDTFPDSRTASDVLSAAAARETLPGVVYGDTDIVDGQGCFVRHRRLRPGKELSWKDFRWGMLVCHQAFYALTEIARRTPYSTRYRYSADVDWCIRVMKEAEREGREILPAGRVTACYLAGGMTTAHHKASLMERFLVMRRHYGLPSTVLSHAWFVIRALVRR